MNIFGGDFFRACAEASGLGSRRCWRVPAVAERVEEVVEATRSRWRPREAGGGVSCVVFLGESVLLRLEEAACVFCSWSWHHLHLQVANLSLKFWRGWWVVSFTPLCERVRLCPSFLLELILFACNFA